MAKSRFLLKQTDYLRIKKMDYKSMNDYLINLYSIGKQNGIETVFGDCEEALTIDEDDFKTLLLEVEGVSEELCDRIMEKIYENMEVK